MKLETDRLSLPVTGLLAFTALAALAQSPIEEDDPLFGVWELDPQQSIFIDRDRPRSQTRIYERHPDGVKATVITVNADGSETRTEYVAGNDSVPSPFYGATDADAIVLERLSPYEAVATFSSVARPIGMARRNITSDGQEMTVRLQMRGNIVSIAVFNKVSDSE